MQTLEKKVPPALQVVIWAGIMCSVSPLLPSIEAQQMWVSLLSVTVLITGGLLAIAGVVEFARQKTTVDPRTPQKASALVVTGVYSISRNPMYVGFALWLLALVVYLRSPLLLSGVIFFVIYMNRFQIEPEERALSAMFGAEWEHYKARVRRWL